jgi:hypothetical protein
LYEQPGFKQMHLYVSHSLLPGGKYVFDFGDIYEGPFTRAGQGDEYKRANPDGRFHTNYNILYRTAARFRSAEAQGVAAWLASQKQYNAEEYWSLFWYDATVPCARSINNNPGIIFADHEVVYWRSDWTDKATAFAFKCGPPEGHHTAAQLKAFPDWHLSAGHAHPDANSFIIFANGQYLTGDTGYAGVPMTEHHNTVLIDGKGQAKEGKGHDAFEEVSYERLNQLRIAEVQLGEGFAYLRGDATAAYEGELGLTQFERHFFFTAPNGFLVRDVLAAREPRIFTSLLHADESAEISSQRSFTIKTATANLNAVVAAPTEARLKIEPNVLTAPGQPGSVDKGERQERGKRVAISTPAPVSKAQFVISLEIAERRAP